MSEIKIGVCLAGGGARGYCHIGVLKQLAEIGIKPYAISGASMGALVGGIYSSGTSIEKMEGFAKRFSTIKMTDLNILKLFSESLLKGGKIKRLIGNMLISKKLEEFPIKFACPSFDTNSGKTYYFRSGDAIDAIYASMAMPIVFKPLSKGKKKLVDGGLVDNMPVELLQKMGCNVIIGVDCMGKYDGNLFDKNAISGIMNVVNIFSRQTQKESIKKCDLVITPDVSGVSNLDFKGKVASACIEAGIKAVNDNKDEIIKLFEKKDF